MTLFNYDAKAAQRRELEVLMDDPAFWDKPEQAQKIIAELKRFKAQLDPLAKAEEAFEEATITYELAKEAGDDDVLAEADEMLFALESKMDEIELKSLLSGKHDVRNCFITISAGDGGTEANDWTEMLFRMYLKYFDKQEEWEIEEVALQHAIEAGIDSVTLHIKGPFAYGYLTCERGTHRLARVSPFNAQGKRQTSFATVDIIPEFEESVVEIPDKELEITAFARSSGPGGQNVNKVASAIRLVHKPTGIMVVSSTYREQPQNKRQAMAILQAKLDQLAEEKRQKELKEATGGDIARGWGAQIRSYVLYDNRVKDHRTNHESGNPQTVLDGDLQPFIDAELQRKRKSKAETTDSA